MRIGLIGYGKMGQAIEAIAVGRGHTVHLRADSKTLFTEADLKEHDVIIEFTNPHSCVSNIEKCLNAGVPVVVGSTGWYNDLAKVEQWVTAKNGSVLHATNFSIGVNLFFSFNAYVASVMQHYKEYTPEVHEIHHTQKLDAPSGTAITTAETILKNHEGLSKWAHEQKGKEVLTITHERIDNVPGTHVVNYKSTIDDITLSHTAHNRTGFATGAVVAAEWIAGKKGIYTMKDVLNINY